MWQLRLHLSVITDERHVRYACPLLRSSCWVHMSTHPMTLAHLGRKAHKSTRRWHIHPHRGLVHVDPQDGFVCGLGSLVAVPPLPNGAHLARHEADRNRFKQAIFSKVVPTHGPKKGSVFWPLNWVRLTVLQMRQGPKNGPIFGATFRTRPVRVGRRGFRKWTERDGWTA